MTGELIDILSDVSNRFQQQLRGDVQTFDIGLTPFESKVLVTIGNLPGATQREVAAWLGCDKAQLARAIKTLGVRSLVARTPSVYDWRAWNLMLTPKGRAVFANFQARRAAVAQACLANVTTEEREMLFSILTKMADGLLSRPEQQ